MRWKEVWFEAQQRLEWYQVRLLKAFNKIFCPHSSQVGHLVLAMRRPINMSWCMENKFLKSWNGPYVIREVYSNGAYKIVDKDGVHVECINDNFLEKYYTWSSLVLLAYMS